MSGYIGQIPTPQATQTRQTFTATASQTSFATGGYQAGYLDVFLNGVKLVDGTDYTATNGSDVVLTTGAASGDTLEVVAYTAFTVADQAFTGDISIENLDVTGSFTSQGIDDNATSTAMTLDSSGNLLVGDTGNPDSAALHVAGGGITHSSTQFNARAGTGNQYEIVNRNGAGFDFYVNNASNLAARIDSSGNLLVGGTTSPSGSGQIVATGGVYLGGTGSANKLDDYERGTWSINGAGATNVTSYDNLIQGNYVKIGDLVTVQGNIDSITAPIGNFYFVLDLPFAQHTPAILYTGTCTNYPHGGRRSGIMINNSSANASQWFIGYTNSSAQSSSSLRFQVTYQTA